MDCDLKRLFLAFFLIQIHGYVVASTFPELPVALSRCSDLCDGKCDLPRVPYPFWDRRRLLRAQMVRGCLQLLITPLFSCPAKHRTGGYFVFPYR